MTELDAATRQIRAKVRLFITDEARFGVLSSGERIAVAVGLDRYDLIQRACRGHLSARAAVWTEAALRVQRNGWQEDSAP